MPSGFDRGSGHWRQYRGEWWTSPPSGAQTWQGFGRRMFFRALTFLAFVVLVVVGLGALIDAAGNDDYRARRRKCGWNWRGFRFSVTCAAATPPSGHHRF